MWVMVYGDTTKDERLEAVLPSRVAYNLGWMVLHIERCCAISREWDFRLGALHCSSNDGGLGITPALGLVGYRPAIAAPSIERLSTSQCLEKLSVKGNISWRLRLHS